MNECKTVNAGIITQQVNAYTFPSGPRGIGIKDVAQKGNTIVFTFDNDSVEEFVFPDWWFGTRDEYNALTDNEKTSKQLYFIEEGS